MSVNVDFNFEIRTTYRKIVAALKSSKDRSERGIHSKPRLLLNTRAVEKSSL